MTAYQKQTVKSLIPLLSFLPAFYIVFAFGQFTEQAESRMFENSAQKEEVISHASKGTDAYENVHMQLNDKDDRYVKKTEMHNIQEDISEIKSANIIMSEDIKELLKRKK